MAIYLDVIISRNAAEILRTLYRITAIHFLPRHARGARRGLIVVHLKIYKKLVKPRRVYTQSPAGYTVRKDLRPLNSELGGYTYICHSERPGGGTSESRV